MSTAITAHEVRRQLGEVVAAYDAATVSGPAAARDVAEFARIEKLAAAGRMLAAARVEETQAWIGSGHRSPQDWLAGEAGTSVAEAAGVLETSKRLAGLPATAEAVRAGDLSAGQARAVAGAAAVDPGAEGRLLATARRETFKGLRDEADRVRAAATDDATRQARIRAKRSLHRRVDADGASHLAIYGPAVDGVRLAELLKPYEEQIFREARTAARVTGEKPTFENRAYDAFMRFAGITHPPAPTGPTESSATTGSTGSTATPGRTGPTGPASAGRDGSDRGADGEATLFASNGGPAERTDPTPPRIAETDPGTDTDASTSAATAGTDRGPGSDAPTGRGPSAHPTRTCGTATGPGAGVPGAGRVPGGANTKIIVRIDHTALRRGHAIAGETVEVAGLGPIPVTTVHELMDDAFLAAVVVRGRDVVNVAHLGRSVNAHQRTALEATGLQCSNIACNATIGTQLDHRIPWATNPETRLDNQDPLCPTDHDRKTHHGWALEPGTGRRRLLPPDHPDHPAQANRTEPAGTRAGPAP